MTSAARFKGAPHLSTFTAFDAGKKIPNEFTHLSIVAMLPKGREFDIIIYVIMGTFILTSNGGFYG